MSKQIVCDECMTVIDPPSTQEIHLKFILSTSGGDEDDEGDYCSWKCLKKAIKRCEVGSTD